MSNNKIPSTQRLMFSQNPNYVVNHYNKPVQQPIHQQPQQPTNYNQLQQIINQPVYQQPQSQQPTNYNQLQQMINQPLHRHPSVSIKPNIVINPGQKPIQQQLYQQSPQRGCNCGR